MKRLTLLALLLTMLGCATTTTGSAPPASRQNAPSEPTPEPRDEEKPEAEPAAPVAEREQAPRSERASRPDRTTNPKRRYQLADLRRAEVRIGRHALRVWVMDTESKRQEGMMHLTDREVRDDEGMLFVFDRPQPLSFWMRNTLIPLDIAYIGGDGRILNIRQMRPLDETGIPSHGRALYALEVKQGTFRRLGVREGMRVEIPAGIRAKD